MDYKGVQCRVYSVQCRVYSVQCTVYTVQSPPPWVMVGKNRLWMIGLRFFSLYKKYLWSALTVHWTAYYQRTSRQSSPIITLFDMWSSAKAISVPRAYTYVVLGLKNSKYTVKCTLINSLDTTFINQGRWACTVDYIYIYIYICRDEDPIGSVGFWPAGSGSYL